MAPSSQQQPTANSPSVRILVKHNGVDRRQRGHRCKECSRGAEQLDSIPLRNGMPCAEAYWEARSRGISIPK